ncbi:hypothetical protein L596_005929 [Steinernema carpocapsae]|uniref:Uncharacterized protein n=1 Tax=Steinernema carpocapsae TaxID=34508 RepID=A0A4U8V248_STECR|nr:hypothetical protein L596_005929 [Steinernema carpocapsae]
MAMSPNRRSVILCAQMVIIPKKFAFFFSTTFTVQKSGVLFKDLNNFEQRFPPRPCVVFCLTCHSLNR